LIKLNQITSSLSPTIYAKMESFNPGQSAKDRIALHMIEVAEKSGKLKPGGTIIEATSGNTGFSLAMISAMKGYKCCLTVSSKISKEKLDLLKIMGAEVVVCPKDAKPDDPRSYYSMAKRLSEVMPNSFYINQNFNLQNGEAHYLSTGPEIWEQTEGKITHYVASCGTGGTLCGTARFLKEQNPDIKIIGVDAYGSVVKKYHETGEFDESEIYSYTIEGTGKSILPGNVKFDIVDEFVKVRDDESALRARELAQKEGLIVGHSSGGAVQALFEMQERWTPEDVVVVVLCDHGTKYLGKIFNDDWMIDRGFMSPEETEQEKDSEIQKLINSI
ncbi:MAG: cysteine synthase family protein, partial [Bacteroidota bacterium]